MVYFIQNITKLPPPQTLGQYAQIPPYSLGFLKCEKLSLKKLFWSIGLFNLYDFPFWHLLFSNRQQKKNQKFTDKCYSITKHKSFVRFFTASLTILGDQMNIAVLFWYLAKSVLSSVHVYGDVHWTGHFLQGTRKTDHVYLVTLYLTWIGNEK